MATSVTGHRIFASVLVPAMFLILIGCSTPNQAPLIRGNIIVSPATVPVGERATITVIATDPDDDPVVFYWEARRGSVPAGAQSDTIVYLAPATSGLDTITVTVSDGQEIATQEVRISVIGSTGASSASPGEPSIAIVTDTPTSSPPEIPAPTPIPPDTPQPTTIPLPQGTIDETGVYCNDNGRGGVEILTIEPPRIVARIRIDMEERATEYGNSLQEIELYGPATGNTNLAIGATATASSAQDDANCQNCFADKAIDGRMNTRWSSDWKNQQWLEIRLPEPQVINRIALKWEAAYTKNYCVSVFEGVTPTSSPPVYITNIEDGATVPPSFSLMGEYSPEITDDIWIMVHPLGGGLYPQSMNPCAGESTPRLNNRWEIAVGLGRPGDVGALFEIRVTTATAEANQFLAQTMQTWCQSNNYVGLSEDELPPGLTEHQRISLVRGSDYWSHPPISNIDLPGELTINSLKEGEAVPQEFVLSGTSSSEVKDSIWVIVFNPNGRFYPQSASACNNIHTIREGNLWQVPIWLGGSDDAGRPFDIITVLADAQADAFLQAKQQASCQANSYSGFLSLQLPPGLDEKASIRVIRQ